MYFESVKNTVTNISNKTIEEQAQLIRNLTSGKALKIGHQIWVSDQNHFGTGIKEVAVLVEYKGQLFQFESITIAWSNSLEIQKDIEEFKSIDYIKENYNLENLKPTIFNDENKNVWFNCDCCGKSFQSTIKFQSIYGLDNGFGYCEECL